MAQAIVHKESTLGILVGDEQMEILQTLPSKGSEYTEKDSIVDINTNDIRPATLRDFGNFSVFWNPDYKVEHISVLSHDTEDSDDLEEEE